MIKAAGEVNEFHFLTARPHLASADAEPYIERHEEETMATELLKDKDYDLISMLYHAAQGVELCQRYSADADTAGDREVAQFFREVGEQNQKLIQRGKDLLKHRLS